MIEINFSKLKKLNDGVLVRRYKDMSDRFKVKIKGNPVIYKVYIKDFGSFETGLNIVNSGKIGNEFYMTKGHKHKKDSDEIYILIKGKGKLIIKSKRTKKINMKKQRVYIIPKKAGHRIVNIGSEKLEVLTIYNKNAGHDYKFSF